MLEVKHLKKEYKSKKGAITKALDDVSLNFPETGMVFILGKSGSGKSTLLNVCGGLDKMDSGEIIIKGKSSKDFTSQDFDSYRNTFVGFVFQEYNILEEFTVEQNVALALELQNKKADKKVIEEILADVDMTEYASRKPNTLSGGQKQRVAIARALVKQPEIIMADEPTGALDSKTGQQVFDTLKKLSQKKLVLVISHDRDFAEQYGDRIIELKDGKIISDQTRAQNADDTNVRFYGTDTVCVTDSAKLTDKDFASIKSFLAKASGSAVISTSREQISNFKQDKPEVSVGIFENIKSQPEVKKYEPQKLIRSHLPVRHAIRMGASGLKTKPVRLVFTILLSVIAFVLFGLASTLMLFNGRNVKIETFSESGLNFITLNKQYRTEEKWSNDEEPYVSFRNTAFTDAEFEKTEQKYSGAIKGINPSYLNISNISLSTNASRFYSPAIESVILATDKLEILAGNMPKADDEVAITEFMYDAIKSSGTKFVYGKNNTQLTVNSVKDVLYSANKPVVLKCDNTEYKIVGVFKGMTVAKDFEKLKQAADENLGSDEGYSQYTWTNERSNGMYSTIAVTPATFLKIKKSSQNNEINEYEYFVNSNRALRISLGEGEDASFIETWMFNKYEGEKKLPLYGLNGETLTSVGNGQIALNYSTASWVFGDRYRSFADELNSDQDYNTNLQNKYNEFCQEYADAHPRPELSDYVDEEAYNAAYEEYQQKLNLFASENHTDEEWESWYAANPQPQEYEFADQQKYEKDYSDWQRAINAYADGKLKDFRRDKAYYELQDKYRQKYKSYYEEKYKEAFPEPEDKTSDEYKAWLSGLNNEVLNITPLSVLESFRWSNSSTLPEGMIKDVLTDFNTLFNDLNIKTDLIASSEVNPNRSITLAGWFDMGRSSDVVYLGADLFDEYYENDYLDSYTVTTKYKEPKDAYIDYIYVPYDSSKSMISELIDLSEVIEEDDSKVSVLSSINDQLDMVIDLADTFKKAFIIAGAILAVFTFLLMFNFISISITAKKKDIGILRAIGARSLDVFKIFLSEALIICLICMVIALLGTGGLCVLMNSLIINEVGLTVVLFVFGAMPVLCIIGIALVTAIVSTVIPVAIYSRKPPIASIRAL